MVGSLNEPTSESDTTLPVVPVGGNNSSSYLYRIFADVSSFMTGEGYLFKVVAIVDARSYEASRVVKIDNDGTSLSCMKAEGSSSCGCFPAAMSSRLGAVSLVPIVLPLCCADGARP